MKILVINGPNINMLGQREPEKYGRKTLKDINNELLSEASELKVELEFFQSNHEGEIVTKIQEARGVFEGIIINPAAYTHTSVAIADAILAAGVPAVEVHLSNIHQREEFRKNSLTAQYCIGQIAGFKSLGYTLALLAIVDYLRS